MVLKHLTLLQKLPNEFHIYGSFAPPYKGKMQNQSISLRLSAPSVAIFRDDFLHPIQNTKPKIHPKIHPASPPEMEIRKPPVFVHFRKFVRALVSGEDAGCILGLREVLYSVGRAGNRKFCRHFIFLDCPTICPLQPQPSRILCEPLQHS